MKSEFFILLTVGFISFIVSAGEVGYNEDFALGGDRKAVLSKLISGAEDYYYYSALQLELEGKLADSMKLIKAGLKRYPDSERLSLLQNRHALKAYKEDPEGSLKYIKDYLGVSFDHASDKEKAAAQYPSRLDPSLVSRATLMKERLQGDDGIDALTDSGLESVDAAGLSPNQLRDFLKRIRYPDYPGLASLIVKDLDYNKGTVFGKLDIHNKLTLKQLNKCVEMKPDLLQDNQFVNIYLSKLNPPDDIDISVNDKEFRVCLGRLLEFCGKLGNKFNSLKANVMNAQLVYNLGHGVYDKALFLSYLKLPRPVSYMNDEWLDKNEFHNFKVDMKASFGECRYLSPIYSDRKLVRTYLMHFLKDESDYSEYEKYIKSDYLQKLFAEVKLLNNAPDAEKWFSLIDNPSEVKRIRDRVEIEILPENKKFYKSDDEVELAVALKNVNKLIVKVFEINTTGYYRRNLSEISSDINLDGLVSTRSYVKTYEYSPMVRHVEKFSFPGMNKAGVYVVDFVGNGVRSRALIRKGSLTLAHRVGAAGYVFSVYNEAGRRLDDALLWINGREFKPDAGDIYVPFADASKKEFAVVTHNGFSVLSRFSHKSENYKLRAGIFIPREQLLAGKKCTGVVRCELELDGTPVDISLLKKTVLIIRAVTMDTFVSEKKIPDFKLKNNAEATFTFTLPDNVEKIDVQLQGVVTNITTGEEETYSVTKQVLLNQINKTIAINEYFLRKTAEGYTLENRGKNGEPISNRAIKLLIGHRDFKKPVKVTLKPNAEGKIFLGKLKDISWVRVDDGRKNEKNISFVIPQDQVFCKYKFIIPEGETLRIPIVEYGDEPIRKLVSLLEKRYGETVSDAINCCSIKDGFLVINGLHQGSYFLFLKREGRLHSINVIKGKREDGSIVSGDRIATNVNNAQLQIQGISVEKGKIHVKIANAVPGTRIHIGMNRFVTDNIAQYFRGFESFEPDEYILKHPGSVFSSNSFMGGEERYVLERQNSRIYPGNMLDRPSLILNPCLSNPSLGMNSSNFALKMSCGKGGGKMGGRPYGYGCRGKSNLHQYEFSCFDFLNTVSPVITNLIPDNNGEVVVPLKQLPVGQHLYVYAVNDTSTVFRQIGLKNQPEKYRDLRMKEDLKPATAHAVSKQAVILRKGEKITVAFGQNTKVDVVDSISAAFNVLSSIFDYTVYDFADNENTYSLRDFSFILKWPEYTDEEKNEFYLKFASHELNYFLFKKDPDYFRKTVLPYLKNKKDKTFMDDFLLGNSLNKYLTLREYSRLNIAEKIMLAQKNKLQHQNTSRYISDLYDVLSPAKKRSSRLFDVVIRNGDVLRSPDDYGAGGFFLSELNVRAAVLEPPPPPPEPPEPSEGDGGNAHPPWEEPISHKMNLRDLEKRRLIKPFFLKPGPVREWCECNYLENKLPRFTINRFWKEVAEWDGKGKFLSPAFIEASSSLTEIMFALAILDLPFKHGEHKIITEKDEVTFKAGNDLMVFCRRIEKAKEEIKNKNLIVNQRFFVNDTSLKNNNLDVKFVSGKFEKEKVYGGVVTISNTTEKELYGDIFRPIPDGSMPLADIARDSIDTFVVKPYSTTSFKYYFYFPEEGGFNGYPATLSKNGKVLASAVPVKFNVVAGLVDDDKKSWYYISQYGSDDDLIKYLNTHNLNRIKLEKIAWRMRNRELFQKVLAVLEERKTYNDTLWSYSLFHNIPERIREYLPHTKMACNCGTILDSPLLKIAPVADAFYHYKEYWPLINARVFQSPGHYEISNNDFYVQYNDFMNMLAYRKTLTDEDKMAVSVYMLLQGRIEEAFKYFRSVNPKNIEMRIQYDYMAAYMAFYEEKPDVAKKIAEKYKDYPVIRWRNFFREVLAQYEEIKEGKTLLSEKNSRSGNQTLLGEQSPRLQIELDGDVIKVDSANIANCTVNFYPMDLELFFSKHPFIKESEKVFTIVKPLYSRTCKLSDGKITNISIPEKMKNRNLMVEVAGAGISRLKNYSPNSLKMDIFEDYGQLHVKDKNSGANLSKVYIKVYVKTKDNKIKFYKDGYTDMRGLFDYASLNNNLIDSVKQFAILGKSKSNGTVIFKAGPIKNIASTNQEKE